MREIYLPLKNNKSKRSEISCKWFLSEASHNKGSISVKLLPPGFGYDTAIRIGKLINHDKWLSKKDSGTRDVKWERRVRGYYYGK